MSKWAGMGRFSKGFGGSGFGFAIVALPLPLSCARIFAWEW